MSTVNRRDEGAAITRSNEHVSIPVKLGTIGCRSDDTTMRHWPQMNRRHWSARRHRNEERIP